MESSIAVSSTCEAQSIGPNAYAVTSCEGMRTDGQGHQTTGRNIGRGGYIKLFKFGSSSSRTKIRTSISGRIIEHVTSLRSSGVDLNIEKVVDCLTAHLTCFSESSDRFCKFSNQTIADRNTSIVKVFSSELNSLVVTVSCNIQSKSINHQTNITTTLRFVNTVCSRFCKINQIVQRTCKQNLRYVVKQSLQRRLYVRAVIGSIVLTVRTRGAIVIAR